MIDLFEKHNVGFVSVTQSFNTSTSSGKLMLNILLSFAQYERELTGERIRDKFASSLKRCASCDSLMKSSSARKNGNLVYRYYTCHKHSKYGTCKALYKNVPAKPLERNVVTEILRILKSPEVVTKINELSEKQNDVEKTDFLDALKNLSESWEYLHIAEKRKILQLLIKNIDVLDDGIKINFNLEGFDGFLMELAA